MTDPITNGGSGRNLRNGLLVIGFALFSAAVAGVWLIVFIKGVSFALSQIPGFPTLNWLGKSDTEDVLRAVWYATPPTVAFIATLIGYHKFGLFREGKPHLTIDLSASSRPVSDEHNHIGVIAQIHNTSKVAVPVFKIEWEMAVVAPYSVNDILEMDTEFFNSVVEDKEFPWHWVSKCTLSKHGMVVEPNQVEQLTYDFIVPKELESCVVSLFVENLQLQNKEGWYRRLFYDIDHPVE